MLKYYMPTRTITGRDVVIENGHLLRQFGKKCLIVTGRNSSRKCGAYDDCINALTENGIEYVVYDEVTPNPTVASCKEAGIRADMYSVDFILGIGGGSPLDAAKGVAIFAANPIINERAFYAKEWSQKPLPIVLVGTTSGTGSEVTRVAVLTDSSGKKHSISDDAIFASLSFGDPRYTVTMPREVSISTGIDAYAHCMEAYFSRKADNISRSHSIRGISMLMDPLAKLCRGELLDLKARELMYEASILGGLSIVTTGTCFPHNVGYYLTEHYNVPHGIACASFHVELLHILKERLPVELDIFLNELGVKFEDLEKLVRDCIPELDIKMTVDEIDDILPRWENNGSVMNTLGNITTDDIREILIKKFC